MILNNYELNPENYYSVYNIIQNGWFPWIKSHSTLSKYVRKHENVTLFRPILDIRGHQTIRKLQGKTILKIIDLHNAGQLKLD